MAVDTPLEWTTFVVFFVAWFARYECSVSYRGGADAYSRAVDALPVRAWVFGLVWTILYALNAGATYAYWSGAREALVDATPTTTHYAVALAVVAANLALNKLWSPLFFGARAPRLALIVAFALLVTAIVALALFGVDSQWLAFALWLPYVVWLAVALYLNVRFLMLYAPLSAAANAPPSSSTQPIVRLPPARR